MENTTVKLLDKEESECLSETQQILNERELFRRENKIQSELEFKTEGAFEQLEAIRLFL